MRILGLVIVVLAIVVGVLPLYTDCQAEGHTIALPSGATIPMTCHWSARAALGISVPLLALGILMLTKRRGDPGALALIGAIQGVIIALVPSVLIGVCNSREMPCNMIMKPSLIFAGILIVMVSLGYWLLSLHHPAADVNAKGTSS